MSFNVAFRWVMFRFKLTNLFLKKMQVPEWGQTVVQWLTARKSRSADLGKTSHGPWVTKEKHGFWVVDIFWIVLFTPLFLWMMSPLSKRNCQNPHSPTYIFMEFDLFLGMSGTFKKVRLELPRFTELLPQSITTTTAPGLFKESVFFH